mgnify:CR=1 FL=1
MLRIPPSAGEAANSGVSPPCGSGPCPRWVSLLQRQNPGGGFPQSIRGERVCFVPYLLRAWDFQFIHSSEGFWNIMASSCTILPQPPSCISQATSPYANYSWVVRPISICGEGYFVLSHATTRDRHLKWAGPKYGALLRPDTYPAHGRKLPKIGPVSSFISRMSYF